MIDRFRMLATLTCLTFVASPVIAETRVDAQPHLWQPRTTSVAVFKNGMGFFVREGAVEMRDGWCVSDRVPPAAFGTFSIFSTDQDQHVDVIGTGPGAVVEFDDRDAPDTEVARRVALEGYVGLDIELVFDERGTEQTVQGRLASIAEAFVAIETPQHTIAVPLMGIARLQLLDLPMRVHVQDDRGDSAAGTATLGMAYLREGITWIPEYTMRILDDGTAELELRATLVNEAEDIIHSDVHFVVGVPSFAHTEYLTPAAVGQVIRRIGAGVAPPELRTQIASRAALTTNAMTADQFNGWRAPDEGHGLPADITSLPTADIAGGEDYSVYTIRDLTARRGEKVIVSLFRKTIGYSDLYRWSPPERMQHLFVLNNDGDTPWTTGPCLAVNGSIPLGEALLRYTPAGGRCELPVTTAVDVANSSSERESHRAIKDVQLSSSRFLDLVTIAGTVRLRNFEREPVHVIVSIAVSGRPTKAPGGTISSDPTALEMTKRSGRVEWTIVVEPGKVRELAYEYERYIPTQ